MKIPTKTLLTDLVSRTQHMLEQATHFKTLPLRVLNWKKSPESWSVLECIEHLNRYGDFYIPEIENKIASTKANKPESHFESGLLGNYFANSMLPKKKLNKMKTFTTMNPVGSTLNAFTIDRFIGQQKAMLALLEKAQSVNLTKTRTGISITALITFRLGDTFRFVIYHNQRHLAQANRAIEASGQTAVQTVMGQFEHA